MVWLLGGSSAGGLASGIAGLRAVMLSIVILSFVTWLLLRERESQPYSVSCSCIHRAPVNVSKHCSKSQLNWIPNPVPCSSNAAISKICMPVSLFADGPRAGNIRSAWRRNQSWRPGLFGCPPLVDLEKPPKKSKKKIDTCRIRTCALYIVSFQI